MSTPRWEALVLTTAMDWGWQHESTRNTFLLFFDLLWGERRRRKRRGKGGRG
jgi:hypothetical protein